jgi:type IV secretory pathway VirB4 component
MNDQVSGVPIKLNTPYTMIVSGQTGSGKTVFVNRLLRNQAQMHDLPPERIIYAYSIPQPSYQELATEFPILEFSVGLPDSLELDGRRTLLIMDDLMTEMQNDKRLVAFFTKMRHNNLSTIFIVQNLYFRSQYAATVTRNAQYMVLFPNFRDTSMIGTLGRQMFPQHKNFITAAFDDVLSKPYGYIFLDLKPHTDNKLRVRTNVFPGEEMVVYRPL